MTDELLGDGGTEVAKPLREGDPLRNRGIVVIGNEADDEIEGDDGGNTLEGGGGRDTIFGYRGRDWILGGEGNDTIYGGEENDTLEGGSGNDTIFGGAAVDWLYGGEGDDSSSLARPGEMTPSVISPMARTGSISRNSRGLRSLMT